MVFRSALNEMKGQGVSLQTGPWDPGLGDQGHLQAFPSLHSLFPTPHPTFANTTTATKLADVSIHFQD